MTIIYSLLTPHSRFFRFLLHNFLICQGIYSKRLGVQEWQKSINYNRKLEIYSESNTLSEKKVFHILYIIFSYKKKIFYLEIQNCHFNSSEVTWNIWNLSYFPQVTWNMWNHLNSNAVFNYSDVNEFLWKFWSHLKYFKSFEITWSRLKSFEVTIEVIWIILKTPELSWTQCEFLRNWSHLNSHEITGIFLKSSEDIKITRSTAALLLIGDTFDNKKLSLPYSLKNKLIIY